MGRESNAGPSGGEPPIVCKFAGDEQAERREAMRDLLDRSRLVRELEDGYEFAFPDDAEWALKLTEYKIAERSCCPFLDFELAFGTGGILMRVRGPQDTKRFIREHAALR